MRGGRSVPLLVSPSLGAPNTESYFFLAARVISSDMEVLDPDVPALLFLVLKVGRENILLY